MPRANSWWRDHRRWLELFVLVNIAFLALDIWLAHSVNQFREPAEYWPLYFSLVAPLVMIIALIADCVQPRGAVWRDLGYLVGWLSISIGMVGVILHLNSHFFYERTLKSLVYAAPFAAPLCPNGADCSAKPPEPGVFGFCASLPDISTPTPNLVPAVAGFAAVANSGQALFSAPLAPPPLSNGQPSIVCP